MCTKYPGPFAATESDDLSFATLRPTFEALETYGELEPPMGSHLADPADAYDSFTVTGRDIGV